MSERHARRVIALAGLFQACALVRSLAERGEADPHAFAASVGSVLRIDAPSAEGVFGGVQGVELGLRVLRRQLESRPRERDPRLTRHAVTLIFLERKLAADAHLRERLRRGVERIAATDAGAEIDAALVEDLAELYRATVGRLNPQVLVPGERLHLEREDNAARVRALLLAGLRAAVLWRQLGGHRLELLLRRARYVATAVELCPSG